MRNPLAADLLMILCAALFAMVLSRAALAAENKYRIVFGILISGKVAMIFGYEYASLEKCYRNAKEIKKHFRIDWLPDCEKTQRAEPEKKKEDDTTTTPPSGIMGNEL